MAQTTWLASFGPLSVVGGGTGVAGGRCGGHYAVLGVLRTFIVVVVVDFGGGWWCCVEDELAVTGGHICVTCYGPYSESYVALYIEYYIHSKINGVLV